MSNIWKPIKGFKGLYEINAEGKIKTLPRLTNFGKNKLMVHGRIRETNLIGNHGYYITTLSKKGVRKIYLLHRLIAEAFIPNPKRKPHINHKDANKLNNSLDNLEWCDHQENMTHAWDNNLIKNRYFKDGRNLK